MARAMLSAVPSFLKRDASLIRQSLELFHSARTQALRKGFKVRGGVLDDFRSTHALIASHVWLVHRRLVKEGDAGKALDKQLFERFWEDTVSRIRYTDVPELTVDRHLQNLQTFSLELMCVYDHCLSFEDEGERIEKLCGGIWRNVYDMREDVQEPTAIEFARYLKGELHGIEAMPMDAMREARIEWRRPPMFAGEGNATSLDVPAEQLDYEDYADPLEQKESPWRLEWTLRGDTFFWHDETKEAVWDLDEDVVWKGTAGDGSLEDQLRLMGHSS